MAGFLNREIPIDALAVILPSVEWMMECNIVKRSHGSLVVLDPTIPWEPKCKDSDHPFFKEEVVLFTHFFGNPDDWEHDYDKHALAKAFAAWKTGLPSIRIQQEFPYLYEAGMSRYGGSAVGPGGLVVAFSGVEQWFDEMIAEMMIAAIKGISRDEMNDADADVEFIGG